MRRFEAMCGMAMKQQQEESLCLLIPLIASSFLSCAPIFQHSSVSFSHSVSHSLAGLEVLAHLQVCVCKTHLQELCVSILLCPPFPAPVMLSQILVKNYTLLNVFCATKNFNLSPANCLSTYTLALSCPMSFCFVLIFFS